MRTQAGSKHASTPWPPSLYQIVVLEAAVFSLFFFGKKTSRGKETTTPTFITWKCFFCKGIGGEGRYTNIHPLEMMLPVSVFLTDVESLFC